MSYLQEWLDAQKSTLGWITMQQDYCRVLEAAGLSLDIPYSRALYRLPFYDRIGVGDLSMMKLHSAVTEAGYTWTLEGHAVEDYIKAIQPFIRANTAQELAAEYVLMRLRAN